VNEHSSVAKTTFGELLKRLRKRAGMTQDDLAAAIGYSRSLIGALERNDRLPDVEVVIQTYLPALGLQEEPLLAAQLVELAADDLINDKDLLGDSLLIDSFRRERFLWKEIEIPAKDEKASKEEGEQVTHPSPSSSTSSSF